MRGTPRRSRSWLEDWPRRARLEMEARRAFSDLGYRRLQRRTGPVDTWRLTVAVPGYETRDVVIEFDRRNPSDPRVYVDGPAGSAGSAHRYQERGGTLLCFWYPGDDRSQRWEPDDGLLVLIGMIAEHLLKEAWWRERGEWIGEEYPHSLAAVGRHR